MDYRIKTDLSFRRTQKFKITMLLIGAICLTLLPLVAHAAAGGKPATKIYNVADTRGMDPGLSKWIADIYNESLWLYGSLVVLIMAFMGLSLGYLMDKSLVLLGINLGKLEHHE